MFRADQSQKMGEEIFSKFNIRGTPTVMILDPDGSEVDWHLGYSPPAKEFHKKIDKSCKGIDTYKYYAGMYAKNPGDVSAVFGLAKKYDSRLNQEKAIALYKEAIALDPEGKKGMTDFGKTKVPNTQYAEYQIGSSSLMGMKVDPEPMKAFIKKYGEGEMVKSAYQRMAFYYTRSGSKEEAEKFFEEAVSKYPNDVSVVSSYVRKIISAKGNLDRGLELSQKLLESMKGGPRPTYVKDLADLYVANGDTAKADSVYGKAFADGEVSMLANALAQYATFWSVKNKNVASALEMAEMVARLKPDEDYYLRQAASVFTSQKKNDRALDLYGTRYVEKWMGDAGRLASYASFWSEQGTNLESALGAAKELVDLSPGQSRSWGTLAIVHQKMKNKDEALKAGEKAVELAPENQKTYYKNRLETLKKAFEAK